MTIFHVLLNNERLVEHVERPYADIAQDTWLVYLEQRDDVPDADTIDDVIDRFGDDARLIATIYRTQKINHHRRLYGQENSPNKSHLLRTMFSIDADDDWDVEDIVDPFAELENFDLIETDERIRELPQEHKDAIKRFIVAWILVEQGYKVPNAVSKQISRDRKTTGLPLVLPIGKGVVESAKRNERA